MPSFTLAPGETYSAPVTIEFPYSSFAGNKSIICAVELQADKQQTFKVPVPLRLGLGDIGLETMAMRDGPDIIVQQMITNYSNKPVDYTAFATYPNLARQERLIMGLKPGATIIKKYAIQIDTIMFTTFVNAPTIWIYIKILRNILVIFAIV